MPDDTIQRIIERAINRIILYAAPQLRMIDDRMNKSGKYYVIKESVGTLIMGMVEGYEERSEEELYTAYKRYNPLSFRQACNKIIHSNYLEFKVIPTPRGMVMSSMNFEGIANTGAIKANGKQEPKKKHWWLASIIPTDFVLEGLNLIKCFKSDFASSNYLNSDLLDA